MRQENKHLSLVNAASSQTVCLKSAFTWSAKTSCLQSSPTLKMQACRRVSGGLPSPRDSSTLNLTSRGTLAALCMGCPLSGTRDMTLDSGLVGRYKSCVVTTCCGRQLATRAAAAAGCASLPMHHRSRLGKATFAAIVCLSQQKIVVKGNNCLLIHVLTIKHT